MFLVILPIFEGFAILVLPTLLGSREMPFPRLGAFAYWTFLMGGLLYYSATLFQAVPDAGWFAYTPLSGPRFSPDLNIDFWVLGLGVAEVGAIAGAVEIIIAVLKLRAPGMSLTRLPLYAWSMLVTAFMILFAFTPLIVGSLLLELERGFGMRFFDPERGGSSLLWQHLFWIFGHPEVYIQFLPATGIVSMVLPTMVGRKISGYLWVVAAMIGIGFLSFGLWAHHMFTVGLPAVVLAFFAAASMMIAIPAGVQIFSWIGTIWDGRVRWNTPFLFVVGFLVTFVLGGITGVMVAAVPFDQQAHDSYFVVAHLHYVLIGGVAFPMFAGVYYWLPKFTGRMMNETLGRWNFWLLFVGVHVTFGPMHIVGLLGMPRRWACCSSSRVSRASSSTSCTATSVVVRPAPTRGVPTASNGHCRRRRRSRDGPAIRSCAADIPSGTRPICTPESPGTNDWCVPSASGRCGGGPCSSWAPATGNRRRSSVSPTPRSGRS
jgi:cytochrome c oxidase subunit I+III